MVQVKKRFFLLFPNNRAYFLIIYLVCWIGSSHAAGPTWTQTDWSGGAGQNTWIDTVRYQSDDGQAQTVSPAGQISIKSLLNIGTGSSPLVVNSSSTVVNSYVSVTSATTSTGSYLITVKTINGFLVGDEILIIQMQDSVVGRASSAGNYEFRKITAINGLNLTLDSALTHTYYSGSFNQTLSSVTQVVKVPNYSSVTIENAGSITASPWNDTTGGIVVFRAKDTLTIYAGSSIFANGMGFRGGSNPGSASDGYKGQSWDGGNLTSPIGGYPNGCGPAWATQPNAGAGGCYVNGAGGSYGGAGTFGDAYGGCTGQPGSVYGDAALSQIFLGSGGGGGHNNGGQPHGGAGGGIILVFARVIIVYGNISANGSDAYQVTQQGQWGAGGGAGGTIYLAGVNVSIGTGLATAIGGNRYNGINAGGHGGFGGSGRIRIDYNTLSGSTSPAAGYTNQIPINDSTFVVSSIYDMGTSVTGPYIASWTGTYNGCIMKIRMRTSSSSTMSGATAWNNCDTLSTGGFISNKTGIFPNQRYVQYQARLFKSGANTPLFQDMTTEFNQPPSAPTLFAPANGVVNLSQTPLFSWSTSVDDNTSDLVRYIFELSNHSDFSNVLIRKDTNATSCQATSANNIRGHSLYYWRVWAKDRYPDSTNSSSFSFTTRNNAPAAFALTLPSGGTEVNKTPRLIWNASSDPDPVDSGALTYRLEIANDSFFVSKALIKTGIPNSPPLYDVAAADSLKGHRTYYWRIYAKDTYPDSTLSSNYLMFKTNNTPPTAVTLQSPPSTGAQLSDRTPLLTWSAASDADSVDANSLNYILEISDDIGFASSHVVLRKQTLSLRSYQVGGGELKGHMTYYWRVYSKDTYPDSTLSSTTWSFKTANTAPGAVALVSPSDGAQASRTPYLAWNPAVDADSIDANSLTYVVEISTTSNFSNIILRQSSPYNHYSVLIGDGLNAPVTYYWRVYSKDSYPDSTASQGFSFTTYTNHSPNPVTLRSPADNASLGDFLPLLDWDTTTDADNDPLRFVCEISASPAFNPVKVRSPTLLATQYSVTTTDNLDGNTTYYWRVFVKDNYPDSSVSLNTYTFKTPNHLPGPFSLSSPANDSIVSKTPLLQWSASSDIDPTDTQLKYDLEISNSPDFSTIIVHQTDLTSTFYQVQNGDRLSSHRTYYWRVWTKDTRPDSTLCSSPRQFRTRNTLPQEFSLASPNSAAEVTTTPLLGWYASADADTADTALTYTLEIAPNNSFASFSLRKNVGRAVSYAILPQDNLQGHMTYFWRVWARDSWPDSTLCQTAFYFRTRNNPPSAVTLVSPVDGSKTNTTPLLRWNAASDPDPADASGLSYVLEISSSMDFSKTVLRKALATNQYTPQLTDSLKGHSTYYWRVFAKDTYPDSTLSANVLSFLTQNTPPSGVSLLSPANGSMVDQQPTLEWTPAIDPDTVDKNLTHIVEISTTNDFSDILARKIGISSTRYTVGPPFFLSGNMTYYWRVYTKDSYPDSTPSSTFSSFTTRNHPPGAFDLVSPASGKEVATLPLFSWQTSNDTDQPDIGKVRYVLEIDTSAIFSKPVLRKAVGLATQYQLGVSENLPDKTKLFWRIFAKDSYPDSTMSVSTGFFFTCNQNSPPQLSLPLFPVNNTIVQMNDVLSWMRRDPDPGDTLHYSIRLSSSPDFASIVASKSNWLGTGLTLNGFDNCDNLKDNTLYYWQVEATDPHGLSSGYTPGATAYFICKRQNNPPTKPHDLFPPDTISLASGDALSWKAEDPDSVGLTPDTLTYSVTISKTSDFANPIGITLTKYSRVPIDSLTSFSSLTDATKYFWKVFATDNHGLSGPSTEGGNFFWLVMGNHPPTVPVVRGPAEGATVTPTDSLAWNASSDNNPFDRITYIVHIGTNAVFSGILSIDTISTTNVRINTLPNYRLLQTGHAYYWRIMAADIQRNSNGWTAGRAFTISTPPPSVPTVMFPLEGQPLFPTESFLWSRSVPTAPGSNDTLRYIIQIDASALFQTPLSIDTIRDTSMVFETIVNFQKLVDLSRYYWRIRSYDNHGAFGEWCATHSFILTKSNHAPVSPIAISPSDSAVITATSSFLWSKSIDPDPVDSVTYTLIATPDNVPQDTVLKVVDIKDTVISASMLLASNKIQGRDTAQNGAFDTAGFLENRFYRWKVAAMDNHHAYSTFSDLKILFYNAVKDTPGIPAQLSPAFGVIAFPPDFLRWTTHYIQIPGDTLSFILQFSLDSMCRDSAILFSDTIKASTQVKISALKGYSLLPTEHYVFWRAQAVNSARATLGFSNVAKMFFSIKHSAPETPILQYPVTQASIVYPRDTLVWNRSYSAQGDSVGYDIWISQSPFDSTTDSSSIPIRVNDQPATKLVLNKIERGYDLLKHATATYWRVRAHDSHQFYSTWSLQGSFTFMSKQPTAPDSLYPPSNAQAMVNTILGWRAATDIDAGMHDTLSYILVVSSSAQGSSLVSVDTVRGNTAIAVRALKGETLLENGAVYYWKVQACNSHGATSDFSSPSMLVFLRKLAVPNKPDSLWPFSRHVLRPFESLRWRGTSPNQYDTLTYHVDISRDTIFSSIVLSVQKDSFQFIPLNRFSRYDELLKPDSVYFWRVRAENSYGELSVSSDRGEFIYKSKDQLATAPVIISPALGAYVVAHDRIVWKNSTDPDDTLVMYKIELSADSGLSVISAYEDSIAQGKSGTTSILLSSLHSVENLTINAFYFLRIYPTSKVDTAWVPGFSSAIGQIWYGDTLLLGNGELSEVTVVTPHANAKNPFSNIALSKDGALGMRFPDSAVSEPVAVKISFLPIPGTEGHPDSTLPKSFEPRIAKLVEIAERANAFATGDLQTYYVKEGAYTIDLHSLALWDSVPRTKDSIPLFLTCHDTNGNGLVDGEPKIPDSLLHPYILNEKTNRWEQLAGVPVADSFPLIIGSAKASAQASHTLRQKTIRFSAKGFGTYTLLAYKEMELPFDRFKVYPSPFKINSSDNRATIEYRLKEPADVEIRIFGNTGSLVWSTSIKAGEAFGSASSNPIDVPWDGRNGIGRLVGNGMYLVKIMAKPKTSGGTYHKQQYLGVIK